MLLTKAQQKHITKTLNGVATAIREEQLSNKEKCSSIEQSSTEEDHQRSIRWGADAAYEKAYHIVKTAAEQSYSEENSSLSDDLEQLAIKLEAQATALNQIGTELSISICDASAKTESLVGDVEDQAALLKNFVKQLRLIIRQTEQT